MHSSFSLIKKKIEEVIAASSFEDAMINQYDLEEDSFATLLEDVDTISFLTPKKIVIGYHFHYLEGNDISVGEKDIDHFLKYIEHPTDEVLLFLTATKLDNRKKIVKTLLQKGLISSLEESPSDTVRKSLVGYSYENGVIPLLVEYCSGDQERLLQECEKLKLYAFDEKKITKQMIEELVKKDLPDRDNLAFSFVRSMAEKNKKEALRQLQELKSYQMDFSAIIGLLESQFRLLYQVLVLNKQHYSPDQIAKVLEVHPFRVKKTMELLPYYSQKAICSFLNQLSDFDYKVKSGQTDSDMLLELLIFNQ